MTQATVLGLSAFYHDSAAALVADGDIVANSSAHSPTGLVDPIETVLHAIDDRWPHAFGQGERFGVTGRPVLQAEVTHDCVSLPGAFPFRDFHMPCERCQNFSAQTRSTVGRLPLRPVDQGLTPAFDVTCLGLCGTRMPAVPEQRLRHEDE